MLNVCRWAGAVGGGRPNEVLVGGAEGGTPAFELANVAVCGGWCIPKQWASSSVASVSGVVAFVWSWSSSSSSKMDGSSEKALTEVIDVKLLSMEAARLRL
jgi:hypothetical protein